MAASKIPPLEIIESRRSYYSLSAESPLSNEPIQELVEFVIKYCPSTYNVQSARTIILSREQHNKLWNDIVPKNMEASMPPDVWNNFKGRVAGFAAAYGTVVFFEDEVALKALGEKNPMAQPMLTEWSAQSEGLHHFALWCALEAEGLGANLQHFNFHPGICKDIKETWNLPESWRPHAQLVFGKIAGEARPKDFEPLETRVEVFA